MTQPAASGSNPAAWGLQAPVQAQQVVPGHGAPGRDLVFVRSPVTGDVRGVTQEEAQNLVFRAGWEPVVHPAAVRLLERQVARETARPYDAALYGLARGLSGGLAEYGLPQGEAPGALALQGIREAYPGTALLGEIGGSLLPLSEAAGALRFASPVAAAAGIGEGIVGAAEGAGALGRLGARVAGSAAEGGLLGATYEAGQSRIEDTPLTAQKLASGFLAGAIPGALIGLPVGAAEGLGARFARRAEALQQEVNLPAVSDADLMKIAHREYGVATPGLSEELQAAVGRDPNLGPDARALIGDKGAVGKVVREQLLDAPALREQAERSAAEGMNAVQELDDKAIEGWIHGQPKRDLIAKWMAETPPSADVDDAIGEAIRAGQGTVVSDAPAQDALRAWEAKLGRAYSDLAEASGEAGASPDVLARKREEIAGLQREVMQARATFEEARARSLGQTVAPPSVLGETRFEPPRGLSGEPTIIPRPEAPPTRIGHVPGDLAAFIQQHPAYPELLAFLNEERAAASRYERMHTAGIPGMEEARAARVRAIAGAEGAQAALADAAAARYGERGTFFRGARVQEADLERMLAEGSFENPNIWSAARQREGAEAFAKKKLQPGEKPVLFEIETHSAVNADAIPGSETFEEMLLPRGRRWEIVGSRDADGVRVIRVREASRADKINRAVKWLENAAANDAELRGKLTSALATDERGLQGAITRAFVSRDQGSIQTIRQALEGHTVPEAMRAEVPRWRGQGLELLDSLGQQAQALLEASPGVLGQSRGEARKVRDLLANARAKLAAGERVDAYAALDELKGRLGPHAKPDSWLGPDDNVARLVRRGYEDVRQMLEDGGLWGERAAGAQREINALLHRRLARADGYFKRFFEDAGVPHPRNPWVNAKKATPEKVRQALAGITDPDKSDALAMFRGHVAETRELADKMKRYYHLSPEATADVERLLKGVDQAEEGLNRAVLYARREAQAQGLFGGGKNFLPSGAKWLALGVLGAPGFAAVQGLNMLANPGQRIFARAVIERMLRGSEARIAHAVLGLVTGKAVKFSQMAATTLAARESASLLHERDPKARAEAYASSLAELTKLAAPGAGAKFAQQAMPHVGQVLPGAHMNTGAMLSAAAQYVLAHAPVRPRLTPAGIVVDLPSDSELVDFEDTWAGAFDPLSAVEDAAAGRGSIAGMRAAEAVAPDLVNEVRMLTISELGKQEVPHSRLVDLSIVLNVPLDSTLEPEYISAQQTMHAARFKQSETMQSRRTGNDDGVNQEYRSSHQSKADRIESEEAPR